LLSWAWTRTASECRTSSWTCIWQFVSLFLQFLCFLWSLFFLHVPGSDRLSILHVPGSDRLSILQLFFVQKQHVMVPMLTQIKQVANMVGFACKIISSILELIIFLWNMVVIRIFLLFPGRRSLAMHRNFVVTIIMSTSELCSRVKISLWNKSWICQVSLSCEL
jgi:hypothetical protein